MDKWWFQMIDQLYVAPWCSILITCDDQYDLYPQILGSIFLSINWISGPQNRGTVHCCTISSHILGVFPYIVLYTPCQGPYTRQVPTLNRCLKWPSKHIETNICTWKTNSLKQHGDGSKPIPILRMRNPAPAENGGLSRYRFQPSFP